jgi:hypothetical protein
MINSKTSPLFLHIFLATKCTLSFASMVPQSTGAGPSYIDDYDFNNDNLTDLIVANYDESTTGIFLGTGKGTFGPQTKFSNGVDAKPNAIAVGDVNKDGRLDMVVANSGASNAGVLLGKGDGTFLEQTTYSTGNNSTPLGLAVGDLNNDALLDLVVSDNSNNILLVFLGNGTGVFAQAYTLATGDNSKPYSIAINDFNGDNRPDIAVSNSGGNNVGIFLSNGVGTFGGQTTYVTDSTPNTLVAVDLNRDGILDIATANFLGNNTSVLLGNGDGTFGQQKSFSTGSGSLPYSIYYGDFNRDNIQDIIVANSGTNNVGILLGYGNGNFRDQTTYSTGSDSNPVDVTVGDYNGDNRLDFISANYRKNTAGIFLSTCRS